MTKGKDNTSAITALQILAWLLEHGEMKDLRASQFQDEINMDRRILRRYFDTFVEAEIATVRQEGLTKIYTLSIKLPNSGGKNKISKEQSKAQKALEDRAFQEKVKYTSSPNEPTWVIIPKFYADMEKDPDLVKPDDIFDPELNFDYLAGICPDCKETFLVMHFDKQLWKCDGCAEKWLKESVFRADSEGELIEDE